MSKVFVAETSEPVDEQKPQLVLVEEGDNQASSAEDREEPAPRQTQEKRYS